MKRFLSLAAIGLSSLPLWANDADAETKKLPGAAAADWAKRATGGHDGAKAQPKEDETGAADSGDSSGESASDTEAQTHPAEAEPQSGADSAAAAEEPSDKTGWTQRVMSPIFSELVMISQPADFIVRFENTKGGSYIREAVLKGETVEDWSQMITVTGLEGATKTGQLTPQTFFENIASGFQRACPQTFTSVTLKPVAVDGHLTYAAVASCGRVLAGKPRSETAAMLVIQGKKDFYTLQWAERGKPPAIRSPSTRASGKRASTSSCPSICATSPRARRRTAGSGTGRRCSAATQIQIAYRSIRRCGHERVRRRRNSVRRRSVALVPGGSAKASRLRRDQL